MADTSPQRALLVAVEAGGAPRRARPEADEPSPEESLAELRLLAETAGAQVVGTVIQTRHEWSPATLIGEGKAREIEQLRQAQGFDLVIFDEELSPSQQRNLEAIIGCGILDRTALILDIFARRARTREARVQVELAQLQYRLPRLAGRGVDLSRLGGGIGTRGPGETRLEVDRRRIRERIAHLRRELREVAAHRERQRAGREENRIPLVALAGYTNAGKSSLHRRLAGSDAYVEDRLFATLDTMVRRVDPPDGEPLLLADTVGFIRKLPHTLVAAFRSTLEEVVRADLILHVVDVSHPARDRQMDAVQAVLEEIGAGDRPRLVVLNKLDRLRDMLGEEGARAEVERLRYRFPGAVAVSAATGEGLPELSRAIQDALARRRAVVEALVPYPMAHLAAFIHQRGRVLAEEYRPGGVFIRAEMETSLADRVRAALGPPAARDGREAPRGRSGR